MSLYVDIKYLNMASHRFELFKRKSDYLFNVRCPICGDSQKNKRKMRGYIFKKNNDLIYKCHNCQWSGSFGKLLKEIDSILYKQYVLERFSDGETGRGKGHSKPETVMDFKPKFPEKSLLDKLMDKLSILPADHEAVEYAVSRGIPKESFNRLYYVDNIQNIVQLNSKYKESIKTTEPRLAIPFIDANGKLTAVSLRGMRGEALRYILVKVNEDAPTVFGLDAIDKNMPVVVVEGPLDSLFIPNSIACAGTSFNKVDELGLNKESTTIVFDNQPRNKEVCKLVDKYINLDYNVVIWPNNVEGKDINDMSNDGIDAYKLIKENTYRGLSAKAKYSLWRKI
jgi:hypothetical protein